MPKDALDSSDALGLCSDVRDKEKFQKDILRAPRADPENLLRLLRTKIIAKHH
jgi:hypothetical protein